MVDLKATSNATITLPASAQWVTTDNISVDIDYSQYATTTNVAVSNYSFASPKRAIDEIYETAKIAKKFYLPLATLLRGVVLVDVFSLKRIFKSHDGDIALPVEKFTPAPQIDCANVTTALNSWSTYSVAWYSSSEQHELSNPGGRANSLIEPAITVVRV